jgi:hypothetical protein
MSEESGQIIPHMCLVQSVTQMLAYKMQKSTAARNVKKLGAICEIVI